MSTYNGIGKNFKLSLFLSLHNETYKINYRMNICASENYKDFKQKRNLFNKKLENKIILFILSRKIFSISAKGQRVYTKRVLISKISWLPVEIGLLLSKCIIFNHRIWAVSSCWLGRDRTCIQCPLYWVM